MLWLSPPTGGYVPLQCSGEDALSGSQIAPFAEPELNRVAIAVDGAIEISSPSTNFDVCFVHVPFVLDGALASIELLKETVQRWIVA
jgi:hypothetical protein